MRNISEMSFSEKLKHLIKSKREGIQIPNPNPAGYNRWTEEEVAEIAMSHSSTMSWRRSCMGSYMWAYRNGLLASLCEHMETLTRGPKRERG